MIRKPTLATILAASALSLTMATPAMAGKANDLRKAIAAAEAKIETARSMGAGPADTAPAIEALTEARNAFKDGRKDEALDDVARATALADTTIGQMQNAKEAALADAQAQRDAAAAQAANAQTQAAVADARAASAEQSAQVAQTAALAAATPPPPAKVETTVTTTAPVTTRKATTTTRKKVVRRPVKRAATTSTATVGTVKTTTTVTTGTP